MPETLSDSIESKIRAGSQYAGLVLTIATSALTPNNSSAQSEVSDVRTRANIVLASQPAPVKERKWFSKLFGAPWMQQKKPVPLLDRLKAARDARNAPEQAKDSTTVPSGQLGKPYSLIDPKVMQTLREEALGSMMNEFMGGMLLENEEGLTQREKALREEENAYISTYLNNLLTTVLNVWTGVMRFGWDPSFEFPELIGELIGPKPIYCKPGTTLDVTFTVYLDDTFERTNTGSIRKGLAVDGDTLVIGGKRYKFAYLAADEPEQMGADLMGVQVGMYLRWVDDKKLYFTEMWLDFDLNDSVRKRFQQISERRLKPSGRIE